MNDDVFEFDFAIAGTGYFVDPTKRPELADFAHHIALWRDRYEPPVDQRNDDLGTHPYLGNAHEYLEKVPGSAPYLKDIHIFLLLVLLRQQIVRSLYVLMPNSWHAVVLTIGYGKCRQVDSFLLTPAIVASKRMGLFEILTEREFLL